MPQYKIVHLTSVHNPFDARILYKECVSLRKTGYEVVLVAPHDRSETVEGVRIHAVPKPVNRNQRMRKTIWQVYQAAVEEDGDLYHFHDPELIPVGMLLKWRRKKVVYDAHENVPLQLLSKDYLKAQWRRKLAAEVMRGVEGIGGFIFDGIIGAIPETTARFPDKKSVTLRNYSILPLIDSVDPAHRTKEKSVVIYAGGLMPIRGIREVIRAMTIVGDRAELWIVGRWDTEAFRLECEQLEGWRHVRYLGYVTPIEVYSFLKLADVGMVTLYPQQNYLTSLPIKAFEYMACSLPMVMSDFPYWRNIFEGAALFVDAQNPEDIAVAILHLLEHPEEAAELGKNGCRAVLEKYNWSHEFQKLLALYEEVLA